MKKVTTILSVAVMSLFFSTVNAQQAIGIKGGLNIASLSGFEGRDRISGHAGVFLHHTINKNWCFQPELLYSGEGQRYMSGGVERTLALGYLQLPLNDPILPGATSIFGSRSTIWFAFKCTG